MPDHRKRTACDETLASVCDTRAIVLALLEHMSDAAVIGDLDGRILAWNTAAEELFGWTADEVVGRLLPQLPVNMRVQAVRFLRETAAAGVPVGHSMHVLRKDGTGVGVDIRLVTLGDAAGNPCAILSLYSSVSDETRFGGSVDRFLNALSQEVTAPLTALQGAAQLMVTSGVAEDSERRERVAKLVRERCKQVSGLVDDLLMVSGVATAPQPLDIAPVDITGLLLRTANETGGGQGSSGVDVSDASQRCMVAGDRRRIQQALSTLVSVAIDQASPRRPRALVYEDAGEAVCEIGDPLFGDRDEPGEPGTESPRPLIGPSARLGLVAHLAEVHGGSFVSLRPERGGFAYTLRLPLSRAKGEQAGG